MKSICCVEGVSCAGTRDGRYGLALIKAEGTASGVFTKNIAKAAPITVMQERIKRGELNAVIANSGCANALTGEKGYNDALTMTEIAGNRLGIAPETVGVASTGVISRYLDLPLIKRQCDQIAPALKRDESAEQATAAAIMTTDTVQKHALVEREDFKVAGICKGSGMIAPNMGTMLAFLYTDAEIEADELKSALKTANMRSFNRVVVDGDTSTNDIALITATGKAGKVNKSEFETALLECCISLGRQIAADGEGASKLIEVVVRNAETEKDAEDVAKTIIGSPLVKTAVYGEDPNWGRIIAAAGRAGVEFDPDKISCWIEGREIKAAVCEKGKIETELEKAKSAMGGREVIIELDLAQGREKAVAWGCDLTEDYVDINGRYTT